MKGSLRVILFSIIILTIFSIDFSNFLGFQTTSLNKESITPTISTIPTPTLVPTLTPTPTPNIVEIKISAIGDCTIGYDSSKFEKNVSYISKGSDLSYYFKNVVNLLSQDDLTIANCETTFTNATTKRKKSENPFFHFKGPPEYAEVFKLGSVEYVNLANNHTYDYGEEGYIDTKMNLDKFDIQYFKEEEGKHIALNKQIL